MLDASHAKGRLGAPSDEASAIGQEIHFSSELAAAVNDPFAATTQFLEIPPGVPFDQPEQTVITWDVALTADELVGPLGTFSWVILMDDDARGRLFETARRVLRDALGVEGDVTVDVGYRAEVWKAHRHD